MPEQYVTIYNMTVKSDSDKMRGTLHWAIGVMITLMVILIGAIARGEVRTNQLEKNQDKIQKDYMPYWAVVYLIESNNKLMKRWNALESKDDAMIQQSIKEWDELQMEIIKQKGKTRSGGSSSTMGGQ